MNEIEIKKFTKLLKKYNSGEYTYDDILDLDDYGLKFHIYMTNVLYNWKDDENK